ncbi:MAG: TIGR03663 family protein [Candidatus Sumerlaeaceae bacterium]|nr:TIGR03663 family protein [Candidatus Sumerlaeaceae bacterium]
MAFGSNYRPVEADSGAVRGQIAPDSGALAGVRDWFSWRVLVIAALAVGTFLRLYLVSAKPLHHDESLFAYYGYFLYKGFGYTYQPILHGPLLQNVSALTFLLFGDSKFAMRLPAIAGGLLMFAVAWQWRRYIGRNGVLAAFVLIALSPSLTFYTRFLRNDMPYLAATAWCAFLTLRGLQTGRKLYLFGAMMAATIMFCMMESSIFFFSMCIGFLGVVVIGDWLAGMFSRGPRLGFPGDAIIFVPRERGEGGEDITLAAAVGSIPVSLGLATFIAWVYGRVFSDSVPLPQLQLDGKVSKDGPVFAVVYFGALWIGLYILCLIVAANYRRPLGRRGVLHYFVRVIYNARWTILAALSLATLVFATLFTTWYTVTEGPDFLGKVRVLTPLQLYKNTWDYWIDQHKLHRIKGPFHYYLPLLFMYELPALVIVLRGWWKSVLGGPNRWVQRGLFALPHLLLAVGYVGGQAIARRDFGMQLDWDWMDKHLHMSHWSHLFLLVFFVQMLTHATALLFSRGSFVEAFLTFWTVQALFAYSYAGEKVPWLTIHTAGPLCLLAGFYVHRWWHPENWGLGRRIWIGVVVSTALLWQFRNNVFLNLIHPWNPAERLVYNHTPPDVEFAVQVAEEVAHRTNYGKQLPMLVRGEVEWPMYWYLREFPNAFPSADETPETTKRPVVMVNWEMASVPNLVENYTIHRLKVREWWEPQFLDLRLMLVDIWRGLTPLESRRAGPNATRYGAAVQEWKRLLRYLAYRDIWLDPANVAFSNGCNEFALCVRKDIEKGLGSYETLSAMPFRHDLPVSP